MANHIVAGEVSYIKLCYENMTLYIQNYEWSPEYVIGVIKRAISHYEESDDKERRTVSGNIDFVLNDLNMVQSYVKPPKWKINGTINIPYDYTLGENETKEDMVFITTEYICPECGIVISPEENRCKKI